MQGRVYQDYFPLETLQLKSTPEPQTCNRKPPLAQKIQDIQCLKIQIKLLHPGYQKIHCNSFFCFSMHFSDNILNISAVSHLKSGFSRVQSSGVPFLSLGTRRSCNRKSHLKPRSCNRTPPLTEYWKGSNPLKVVRNTLGERVGVK